MKTKSYQRKTLKSLGTVPKAPVGKPRRNGWHGLPVGGGSDLYRDGQVVASVRPKWLGSIIQGWAWCTTIGLMPKTGEATSERKARKAVKENLDA